MAASVHGAFTDPRVAGLLTSTPFGTNNLAAFVHTFKRRLAQVTNEVL